MSVTLLARPRITMGQQTSWLDAVRRFFDRVELVDGDGGTWHASSVADLIDRSAVGVGN